MVIMKIIPKGDHVFGQYIKKEKVTKNGIILTDISVDTIQNQIKVIAVGDGDKISKYRISKDDILLVRNWGGDKIEIDGEEYHMFNIEEVYAIINK